MANKKVDNGKEQNREHSKTISERKLWHSAFNDAAKAEFIDYLDKLTFEFEHQLNTEPLRIDVLIIKKEPDVVIEKNIGTIFKQHNIVEYKSPTDYLSVGDYHKVMAYTHLYMSIEKLRYTDVTVTFVSHRHPKELKKYLEEQGCTIEQRYAGILYVTGAAEAMPIQIIVSRELDETENLWFRGLTENIEPKIGGQIVTELAKLAGKTSLSAYMDVFLKANEQSIEGVIDVARISEVRLEDVLERIGVRPDRWEARARAEGATRARIEMAIALVNEGDSIERAARIAGIPAAELEQYLQ